MSILKNAVDSIAIGLEDFESDDDRRIISSTRNIFAGILLLFKHRLCELSPEGSDEALIKQKVLPAIDATGAVNWIGQGKKTVDVQNIKDRFKSLGIEAACELSLETLTYVSDTILDAFKKYQCQECGSGLIEAQDTGVDALEANFNCRSCGHSEHYEELSGKALAEYFAADFYLAHTDGNDVPAVDCPSCYQGTYLIEEGICSICSFTAASSCIRCGGNIPPEEISESDMCGYCSYMADKIMRE
ncbi:hypothetical protein [Vibrio parahaemolyticus]|uniref:hypothetical protein n=1 Tax=Vibrio parahaemolyticus TaxID=670 RepID=UPI00040AE4C2|nr:hypothetical protein [Vibrio parahaemolyticus]